MNRLLNGHSDMHHLAMGVSRVDAVVAGMSELEEKNIFEAD